MNATDRIFQGEDELWYFSIRGNQAAGPFESQGEAATALSAYVRTCQRRTEFSLSWPEEWSPARLLRRTSAAPRHS